MVMAVTLGEAAKRVEIDEAERRRSRKTELRAREVPTRTRLHHQRPLESTGRGGEES